MITPLDLRPQMDFDQSILFQQYSYLSRPSRKEGRPIYLADIAPAIAIYQPEDNKEFVHDILSIEAELICQKESSESELMTQDQ